MSLVILTHYVAPRYAPADDLTVPLSAPERRDVQAILDHVAFALAQSGVTHDGVRRRLDAVISELIDAADALDGDCEHEAGGDLEPDTDAETLTATETRGRGFHHTPLLGHDDDEDGVDREIGETDDNGIADEDGRAEQRGLPDRYGAWVAG